MSIKRKFPIDFGYKIAYYFCVRWLLLIKNFKKIKIVIVHVSCWALRSICSLDIQQILEYASGINSVEVVLFSVPGCALPNELLHYRKNRAVIRVFLEFCGACRPPWGVVWEGAIPRVLGCELRGADWAVTINKVMKAEKAFEHSGVAWSKEWRKERLLPQVENKI